MTEESFFRGVTCDFDTGAWFGLHLKQCRTKFENLTQSYSKVGLAFLFVSLDGN